MVNRGGAALATALLGIGLGAAPAHAAVSRAELALRGIGLGATPAHSAVSRAELVLRWAPIHYQDVDATGAHALGGRSAQLTRVDFDGDLNGRNNWDNAARGDASFTAYAYCSVLETATHWYLTYFFFHPRDWTDHPFFETEHENDGEGVLLAVERDGSAYGVLRSAVTVAHSNFYSYVPAGSTWTAGRETVDGTLRMQPSPHDPSDTPPPPPTGPMAARCRTRSPRRRRRATGSRPIRSTGSTVTGSSTTRPRWPTPRAARTTGTCGTS